ncbi:MAG TPA: triphosphoribosyl-dephospho-CoA synthase MdcB [Methylovirgula sp.]|jgi:triphosphoribosyl-dephospho-CoA synthase|nr:triphosphoribosyl-dephospho-CoA synthase MdcB [Methylovirgula sp.]
MSDLRLASRLTDPQAAMIDRLAVAALVSEVTLYPKAGLVSLVDSGSHTDMDAQTFLRSAQALAGYFAEIAMAAADDAPFVTLKKIGQRAEARMFSATAGVNTHRGAIFSLGLLAAAAGIGCRDGRTSAADLCTTVATRWGKDILASRPPADQSHGAQVRSAYGAPGAREEAASGFPTVLLYTMPAYREAFAASGRRTIAALHAFYAGMVILEDNNLLYRAGPDGLAYAQAQADGFIRAGGMLAADGFARGRAMHDDFTARWLSPGGSADLLILTLFLTSFETAAHTR